MTARGHQVGLTPREREVLEQMAQGRSNSGIAAAPVVTDRAVAKHVANLHEAGPATVRG